MTETKRITVVPGAGFSTPEEGKLAAEMAGLQIGMAFSNDLDGFIHDKYALWKYGYDPEDDDDPIVINHVRVKDGALYHLEIAMHARMIPEEWEKFANTFKLAQKFDTKAIVGKEIPVTDTSNDKYVVFLPSYFVNGDLPLYMHFTKKPDCVVLGRIPGTAVLPKDDALCYAKYLGAPFRILGAKHFPKSESCNPWEFCHTCDKKPQKLLKCTRCKIARYCSKECQLKNWPLHKLVCR